MKEHSTDKGRRALLKGIASLPVIAVAGYHVAGHAEMLSVEDPMAKALAYTEKSTTDGQSCANCNFYQGADKPNGACPIFPGKEVVAPGWCKSWVKKA